MKKLRDYFRLLAEDRIKGGAAPFLYPLLKKASLIYGDVIRKKRQKYKQGTLKAHKLPFPVISVGNLTWGGSGKTPLVEYLARHISEQHKNPLILTRGYGKDEVEQYRNHLPRVLLGVGSDRVRAAEQAARGQQVDAAILDDGFQHWKIQRDLDIVCLNALNPFGNGELIPRGPLREPAEALARAHIIVILHGNLVKPEVLRGLKKRIEQLAPSAALMDAVLEPMFLYRASKKQQVSLDRLQNQKVTTFSAVGAPRSFQLLLSHSNIKTIRNFEYTDHHLFSRRELEEIKTVSEAAASDDIITTEKDFFRAPQAITSVLDPLVLAIRLKITSGEEILTGRLSQILGAGA